MLYKQTILYGHHQPSLKSRNTKLILFDALHIWEIISVAVKFNQFMEQNSAVIDIALQDRAGVSMQNFIIPLSLCSSDSKCICCEPQK